MKVSFDIYQVLNAIEIFFAMLYFFVIIFYLLRKNVQLLGKGMLFCSSILLLTNVFQLPIEIQMEKPYTFSIITIIFWLLLVEYWAYSLGKSKKDKN